MQKITVNLPQETIEVLKRLAEEQGITATAALRKAIATEDFLRSEAINKDAKVIIQEPNGVTKQIVFR
ncbi:ribbon-helix-helix protein, CopG family [Nostoc commune]|nr:ribbon-helix-helix protein, CopG family [Nostoc commune]